MIDMKPCPFCVNRIPNNRPIVIWDSSGHSVCCKNCGVNGPNTNTASQAVEMWNQRPTQSVPSVDLIIAQKAYIDLLSKSLDSSAGYLSIHGWKTPQEDIDEGTRLRDQIALLTDRQGGKSWHPLN